MFVFVCAVCSFQVVSSFVLFGECVYVCCSMGVMPEIKIYIHTLKPVVFSGYLPPKTNTMQPSCLSDKVLCYNASGNSY